MRWGLGGRTLEFSVWVLVLGVLTATVIGQQQQQQRQQLSSQQQQQQSQQQQHPGDSKLNSNSLANNKNLNVVDNSQPQQRKHSSQAITNKSGDNKSQKLSDENVKVLEASLLKMFGMITRPRPKRNVHIPQYILDLYQQHNQDSEDVSFNFKVRGTHTHSANTIRSFYHKDDEALNQGDHNHARIEYDIGNIPGDETITAAELRVYRHLPAINGTQPGEVGQGEVHGGLEDLVKRKHRIDVYEIIKPVTRTREAITRLIDTRIVRPEKHSQWESFDVHPAVLKWRQSPHLNFGLEVRVSDLDGQSSKLQHVRLKRSVGMDESQWMAQQPLLVTYSDDGKTPLKRNRTKRSSRHRKRSKSHHYSRKKKQQYCRRHRLYVDFSDVGWNDWIVAPPGYDAYYCHGLCDMFPLPEYINTTNHAIVQSLVHSKNPKAVPLPCCVPTELTAISMLYLDEFDKVVLKNYQDMVVQGCGCR